MGALGDKFIKNNATKFAVSGYDPNVRYQGRLYHSLGPLVPDPNEQKKCAQFFIHDGSITAEQEAQQRMNSSDTTKQLDKSILMELQQMLHRDNRFVKDFKFIGNLPDKDVKDVQFVLRKDKPPKGHHRGRYNLPTCDEVALININEALKFGDVKVFKKGGGVQYISEQNPEFDPLHFVLIYPDGQSGWTNDLKQKNGKKLTALMYYKYLFQYRSGKNKSDPNGLKHFNLILRSSRLMQEYACSMWFKIERDRLNYIENQLQDDIRAASYKGLLDALSVGDDGRDIGRRVVLPSSFIGSPRW